MDIVVCSDNPYSDCPPATRYLQEEINKYLEAGYRLYGNPYMDTKGGNYPATYQMMMREDDMEKKTYILPNANCELIDKRIAQALADALEGLIGGVEKYQTPETETHYPMDITDSWPIEEPLEIARKAIRDFKGE